MAIASLCLLVSEFCAYYHIDKILCTIGICIDNQRAIQYLHDIQTGYDSRKYDANADVLSIIEACPEVVAQL
jgi:hypothetical protein